MNFQYFFDFSRVKMSVKVAKVSTEKHEGDIMSVAFNDSYVFTGGADGQVKVAKGIFVLGIKILKIS